MHYGDFGIINTTSTQDRNAGLLAVNYFYNKAKTLYPAKVTYSFEELVKFLDSKSRGAVQGLGLGIHMAEIDNDDVKDAMENAAKMLNGEIPSNITILRQALIDEAQSYNFAFWKNVATATASDVKNYAVDVGVEVANVAGKMSFAALKPYLPWIAGTAIASLIAWRLYTSSAKTVVAVASKLQQKFQG